MEKMTAAEKMGKDHYERHFHYGFKWEDCSVALRTVRIDEAKADIRALIGYICETGAPEMVCAACPISPACDGKSLCDLPYCNSLRNGLIAALEAGVAGK